MLHFTILQKKYLLVLSSCHFLWKGICNDGLFGNVTAILKLYSVTLYSLSHSGIDFNDNTNQSSTQLSFVIVISYIWNSFFEKMLFLIYATIVSISHKSYFRILEIDCRKFKKLLEKYKITIANKCNNHL